MRIENTIPVEFIASQVKLALLEDIGQGDLTAALIPNDKRAVAKLIAREPGVLAGTDWVTQAFQQCSPEITLHWFQHDGSHLQQNDLICEIRGNARAMLSAERTALNFLQTLSGTATLTRRYIEALQGLNTTLLDTRKTIPGLRLAQKYAVRCGGGSNHRFGLFDAILIKENHIQAAGNIQAAVKQARNVNSNVTIELEVENLEELQQGLHAGVDIILLDNFSIETLSTAVELTAGQTLLEASGGITIENIRQIAETGVNRISVGSLTKDVCALDLSMRFN
ncbi:Quinolinate phosphoribosyltransferase (decarboxylating) [Methylophaga frappieri]|uniref:Probable nicotinate-nucleotide pyrophosphorylase [carboxylating] n=1 Tax=Methylophaga frappieri (strain ATCC BAA-2434 / DSM 25690 / JAM7) TaxID=754477 RepID=I1YEW7_METFJ|nr:carboxylating nicotinate-nucleotide diphosphorylase [Methylophaga frappieri]AFJ01460.1 Quinolinate phosphoribosyltransferase (decarboxylating) [Methylophaga frappieri]